LAPPLADPGPDRDPDRGPDPERDFLGESVWLWMWGSPFTRANLPKVHCKGKPAFVICEIPVAPGSIDQMNGDLAWLEDKAQVFHLRMRDSTTGMPKYLKKA